MSSLLEQKRRARTHARPSAPTRRVSSRLHRSQSLLKQSIRAQKKSNSTPARSLRSLLIVRTVAVLPFVVLLVWLALGPWLKVGAITCSIDTQQQCPNEVSVVTQRYLGKPIGVVQADELSAILATEFPLYRVSKLDRDLPHTLHVTLSYQPIAYAIQINGVRYLVNDVGQSIDWKNQLATQPVLELSSSLSVMASDSSRVLDPQLHQGLTKLHTAVQHSTLPLSSVLVQSLDDILLTTSSGKTFRVHTANIDNQLRVAQQLIDYPLDITWTEMDLRFSKPVARNDLLQESSTTNASATTSGQTQQVEPERRDGANFR